MSVYRTIGPLVFISFFFVFFFVFLFFVFFVFFFHLTFLMPFENLLAEDEYPDVNFIRKKRSAVNLMLTGKRMHINTHSTHSAFVNF